jgi:hypothetical protein
LLLFNHYFDYFFLAVICIAFSEYIGSMFFNLNIFYYYFSLLRRHPLKIIVIMTIVVTQRCDAFTLTEPFSMQRAPFSFITSSWDHSKTHDLTNHILHPSPAPDHRVRLSRRCAGGAVLFVRHGHQRGPREIFPQIPRIFSMGMK